MPDELAKHSAPYSVSLGDLQGVSSSSATSLADFSPSLCCVPTCGCSAAECEACAQATIHPSHLHGWRSHELNARTVGIACSCSGPNCCQPCTPSSPQGPQLAPRAVASVVVNACRTNWSPSMYMAPVAQHCFTMQSRMSRRSSGMTSNPTFHVKRRNLALMS